MVNVHDLTVFAPITSLEKTRGATMFVLDLQVKYLIFDLKASQTDSVKVFTRKPSLEVTLPTIAVFFMCLSFDLWLHRSNASRWASVQDM